MGDKKQARKGRKGKVGRRKGYKEGEGCKQTEKVTKETERGVERKSEK